MTNLHLFTESVERVDLKVRDVWPTDCLSYFLCSRRRTPIMASNRSFFFSSNSSACNFSLACCFRSMSVRRFCAVDDELWDNVPSRLPNNLCPRLRSSNWPLLRRSKALSTRVGGGDIVASADVSSPLLRRGLFASCSETMDFLRLVGASGEFGCSLASGIITAEAMALVSKSVFVSRRPRRA